MVQSLELILDDALDEAVRREWQTLADAGLPSQARHTGASNRPHITLSVAENFDRLDALFAADVVVEPIFAVRLGATVVFRGRSATLARSVIPSTELLEFHRKMSTLSSDAEGLRGHTAPGQWTPHVTLARRLGAAELVEALLVLDSAPSTLVGTTAALRRWDGDRKEEWLVGGGQNR